MKFKRLSDLDLKGLRVFIRSDLNVPMDDNGAITDDTRIRASVPAIQECLGKGAAVMVTSHLGRPEEGKLQPADSLAPVAKRLAELLGKPVRLQQDWVDGGFAVAPGEVVMLENCRGNRGEKKDDEALARKMAALCDLYVNDAFGTAHRAEATTHGIARFAKDACAGPLLAAELDALGKALHQPRKPLVAIVAGSSSAAALPIPSCWPRDCPSASRWPSRDCLTRPGRSSPGWSSAARPCRSRWTSSARAGSLPMPSRSSRRRPTWRKAT